MGTMPWSLPVQRTAWVRLTQPGQTRAHWGSERMSFWQIERALMMRLAAPRKPGTMVSMDASDQAQAGAF